MIKERTPGPWRAKKLATFDEPGHVLLWPDKGGTHLRRVGYKGNFTEADANRIVECVNACSEIESPLTELADLVATKAGLTNENERLKLENSRLTKALADALNGSTLMGEPVSQQLPQGVSVNVRADHPLHFQAIGKDLANVPREIVWIGKNPFPIQGGDDDQE